MGSPSNIQIVNIDLKCSYSVHIKNLIFGDSNSERFDGIHMKGEGASRHFTYRTINALRQAIYPENFERAHRSNFERAKNKESHQVRKERSTWSTDYHATCPQAVYQREQISARLRFMRNNQSQPRLYSEAVTGGSQSQPRSYSDAVTGNNQSQPRSWASKLSVGQKMPHIYNVPTSNYYEHLN